MSDILPSNDLNVHNILISLANELSENDIAVFASGGIDSWSVVFALLEIGKRVHIYSFTLEDRESYDFCKSKELAQKYNLEFTPVFLPISLSNLKEDVLFLEKKFQCRKKVEFECLWPFLYAYSKVTESTIGSGLCADGYFCISKSGMLHYKDAMDEFRRKYFSNNGSQFRQHILMAEYFEKKLFMPYKSEMMYQYFLHKTWNQCNRPRQKQLIFDSFSDKFLECQFKKHLNLQLGDSGISQHFDKLLLTDWNIHNYKSVVGIFNMIVRGELNGRQKLI